MDEAIVTQIDAHVREGQAAGIEEDEVAGRQVGAGDVVAQAA